MSGSLDDAPDLTDEQQRPLGVTGSSVALSAGAGCGKTTVLTSRFLVALDGDGTPGGRRPLGALVALTFTEKAARELRKRIRGECRRRLAGAPVEDVGHWRAVLRGLEAAPVSTFHEYCAGLLRRHALDAGIDPDFQVLDAAIADSVRDEALSRCLRGWLADCNNDLIELAVEYGLRSVREAVGALVVGRDAGDLAAWALRTEPEVLTAWRDFWDREGRAALSAPLIRAAAFCKSWLDANELDHPKLKAMRAALVALLPGVEPGADRAWLAELRERAKVPTGLRAQNWPSAEANESAKEALKSLRDAIDKYLEKSEIDEAVSLRCAADGLRYARLALDARRAYDDAKRARGGLDFDDLLVKTRDLLRAVPADPDRVPPGQGVAFVLVDEFQDTDPIQSDILRSLTGDEYARGRLFVVGDFKQSIYRFRGARPQLFQDVRGEFPAEGRHVLTENFRSAVGVIDFVNALFADAFPGETPRLVPGPNAAPAAEGPVVEFVWAEDPEDAEEGDRKSKATSAGEMRGTEARWLARLIRTRLDAGWPVRDRRTKQVRNAEGKDVALLFRAMTDLAPYENALQAEGIDFHVVGGKAFYAQQEVLDLVNVLSVIEDPVDQVALAGALRGPFFGLSDDALFRLAGAGTGDLAGGLERPGAIDGLSALDGQRAARACGLLSGWRGLKDRLPIAGLVDRVLDESGFEAALLGEFLGDRKRANARKLVRLARRYDARGGFTLNHFVARLREDLRRPPREEQASTTEEEGTSVRLMSIHQSKGLEFPIVVVPDLNRKQDLPRKAVAFHPDLGPLVRPGKAGPGPGPAEDGTEDDDGPGRTLGRVAFEAVERIEEDAESVRLFYVATTRARDALILSAGAGPGAKPVSAALRLLDERFDRRTGACKKPLPEGWAAPSVRVTTVCPPRTSPGRGRARKPRLRAVARVIETAPSREPTPARSVWPPPRFVDLDAARGLSPRGERLDRLVRSTLADPRVFAPGMLADVARLAARRQDPMAHADLVAEAVRLLGPWVGGPFGADLARSEAVDRGKEWTLAFGGTVFHGRAEFFTRDPKGNRRAVIFSPPGASESVERLRLLLCSRAVDEPVVQGWRVPLGGGLRGEDDFSDEAIRSAVKAAAFRP